MARKRLIRTALLWSLALGGMLAALVSLIVLAAVPDPVHSAFPGGNGKIAFVINMGQGNFDIHVMNSDGSGVTRLTDDPAADHAPAWSPDGSKIAFTRAFLLGQSDIWVMNADGSGQAKLTDDGGAPAWSPDGTNIVFARMGDIWVMNADGSSQVNLTNNPASYFTPAWSPDGTRIAFARLDADSVDIWVMNADGSAQANLTNYAPPFTTASWRPAWSPDGAKIAFGAIAYATGERVAIDVMNADGTGRATLPLGIQAGDPAWSPDGGSIAFTTDSEPGGASGQLDIEVANSDGTGKANLTNTPDAHEFAPDWQPIPSDVGVAAGGFRTGPRLDLSRCEAEADSTAGVCDRDAVVKVKNYGDGPTAVNFEVASDASSAKPGSLCQGATGSLAPGATESISGCTVVYDEAGTKSLTLTTSPAVGTDVDLTNNSREKTVNVVP